MALSIGHKAYLQALMTRLDLNDTIVNIVRYDGDRVVVNHSKKKKKFNQTKNV